MAWPSLPRTSWKLVALTGVYFVAGKLGLSLAFVHAANRRATEPAPERDRHARRVWPSWPRR